MPNLKTTPLEKDLFIIDSEDYVNSICDMSNEQKTGLPKHRTIKLLERMSEYTDTFLKFITEFYIDILIYVISKNNPNVTLTYAVLVNYENLFGNYIVTLSDEELFEQSLQVLAALSFLIYEKKKLRLYFEEKFDLMNHTLINIQNEFLKAKLCNFYSFTLDDMYHDHNNILSKSFDDSIHFLFQCLLNENKNLSLNLMALEAINSLIFDEEIKLIITDFVKFYLKDIFNLLHNNKLKEISNNIKYHQLIKNLLTYYYKDLEENIKYVFLYFWDEIKKELDLVVRGERKDNALQSKNFKLLEMIYSIKGLVRNSIENQYKNDIYNEILILTKYIDKFINYEYEEDILNIISIIFRDIKLIPSEYTFTLNLLLDRFIKMDHENNAYLNLKFEKYYISFIFTFLQNLKENDALSYKDKIYTLIYNKLTIIDKYQTLTTNVITHTIITNLLITYIIVYRFIY